MYVCVFSNIREDLSAKVTLYYLWLNEAFGLHAELKTTKLHFQRVAYADL